MSNPESRVVGLDLGLPHRIPENNRSPITKLEELWM